MRAAASRRIAALEHSNSRRTFRGGAEWGRARLAVRPDATRRGALDEALWTYTDESFLPHGQAEAEGLDAAALLMDGTDLPVDAPFTRCMVMFDDGDATTRQKARDQFKAAKDAGLSARYFQQGPRGWQEAGKS